MLSKPATMLLGLIYEKPLNAYEITKLLGYMSVRWWFNIADSTVYTTIKNLEKKGFIGRFISFFRLFAAVLMACLMYFHNFSIRRFVA